MRAVLNLAGELGGLTTVAEGIETATTADWLRQHGCNIGQGYYFSPPLTADKLRDVLIRCRESGARETLACPVRRGSSHWSDADVPPQIELMP